MDDAVELSWGARCAGLAFFSLSIFLVALAAVLLLVRRWPNPWCGCHVCRAYLTGSWAKDFTNLADWYAHLLRESPTGTVHFHVLGCTVTANPANVEYMLKTRFDNFPKGRRFAALLGDLLGAGIFNFDSKFCAAADVLPDGTYVEGESRVMYHPYAMGRMPSIWGADYEAFRPDRWLTGPGGSFAPANLYKYPVFQAGLRVCLGKELAITEMKVVGVAVVKAFDVEVVGEHGRSGWAPTFVPGLTASISGGLPVRIIKRTLTPNSGFT
ncbi:unnamed protein product [Triticum turgidum subsp. durum]|uniref:Cytochrome P450 n=1 Tax=Triticum turgidum subsp. durum TaxID=4567 RepID=A0A9R1Q400_TRITD|nr:unnamed protein product [Triticum turgidum subsp. durum]